MTSSSLRGALLNRWVEFGGGSRPGTRFLKFTHSPSVSPTLSLHYVFDLDTGEATSINFHLDPDDLETLFGDLIHDGHAKIDRQSSGEHLSFEWRLAEGRLQFRMEGHAPEPFGGPAGFHTESFLDVFVGSAEAPAPNRALN